MKIENLDDLDKISLSYTHAALYDDSDNVLIPYNLNRVSIGEQLQRIKSRLSSPAAAGTFKICFKNSVRKNVTPDIVEYSKGVKEKPDNLGISNDLNFARIYIDDLKEENERLKKNIEEMNKLIIELETRKSEEEEEEEEEEGVTLADAVNPITNLLTALVPLITPLIELYKENQLLKNRILSKQLEMTEKIDSEPEGREDLLKYILSELKNKEEETNENLNEEA